MRLSASVCRACGLRATLANYLEICRRRWLTARLVLIRIPELFLWQDFPQLARGDPREPLSFARSAKTAQYKIIKVKYAVTIIVVTLATESTKASFAYVSHSTLSRLGAVFTA